MAIKQSAPCKSKKELARPLGISRQSLYYKPKLPEKDLKLKAEIEKVMAIHKAYGHKRIALDIGINKKRALRVMKLFNLKPLTPRIKFGFRILPICLFTADSFIWPPWKTCLPGKWSAGNYRLYILLIWSARPYSTASSVILLRQSPILTKAMNTAARITWISWKAWISNPRWARKPALGKMGTKNRSFPASSWNLAIPSVIRLPANPLLQPPKNPHRSEMPAGNLCPTARLSKSDYFEL